MIRLLALLVVVVFSSIAAVADEAPNPPYVMISVPNGHGSGVSLGHRLYLTAAHVVDMQPEMPLSIIRADGQLSAAKVVWKDADLDLALVESPSRFTDAITVRCATAPAIGEAVYAYGYPLDLDTVRLPGSIAGTHRPYEQWQDIVPMSIPLVYGMSGGAVVDAHKHLVGISVGVLTIPSGPFAPVVFSISFMVPLSGHVCDILRQHGITTK